MQTHFGVVVKEGKYGLKLSRDKYAIISNKNSLVKFQSIEYADEEGKIYTDEWCQKHRENCLVNYDLNMQYFTQLNHNDFDDEVRNFLKRNKGFNEVTDLNLYNKVPGYYIMILDDYCQLYIGTTIDIKRRVMQHWSNTKQFDRLLLPMNAVNTSIMSIDSFRAFDTTRILAYKTNNTYSNEDEFIQQFSPQYTCNRLDGGKITGGYVEAISKMKTRQQIK